jgi:hypothetical protein
MSVASRTAVRIAGLALFSIAANADQRALIVGVGDYAALDADLTGIDVDMEMMTEVAINLGFADDEIKVLYDADATLENIERAMTTWVRDGVRTGDTVLIYFSGHGSRVPDTNGDEEDGADEVYLPHDAYVRRNHRPGEPQFGNIVIDDEFATWLAAIPSRNVIVFFDSCHSGSATRSVALGNRSVGAEIGQSKFLYYEGVPRGTGNMESPAGTRAVLNYASLSASRDDQPSFTTISGGYFTQGVWRAVKSAVRDSMPISLEDLRSAAELFVESRMDEERMYHPTLSGSPELISRPLPLTGVWSGRGPRWRRLEALATDARSLSIAAESSELALGEVIELEVTVPIGGYLNVISVDASDETTVLFPNRYNRDNAVKPGRLTIPTAEMPFSLYATEPIGPTLVAAILTEEPIDAYELGVEGRDERGVMQEVFTELSPRAALTLRDASTDTAGSFLAGVLAIDIIE